MCPGSQQDTINLTNSIVPIGLSRRDKRAYGTSEGGNTLSIHMRIGGSDVGVDLSLFSSFPVVDVKYRTGFVGRPVVLGVTYDGNPKHSVGLFFFGLSSRSPLVDAREGKRYIGLWCPCRI